MTTKKLLTGGASHLGALVYQLEEKYAHKKYQVQSIKIADPGVEGAVFQVNTGASVTRTVTGLLEAGTVKFVVIGKDIEFEVFGGQWIDKAVVGGIAMFLTGGILLVPAGIGAWKQKQLLKQLYDDVVLLHQKILLEEGNLALIQGNLTLIQWWDLLDVNWKTLFKKATNIDYEPKDKDLEEMVNLRQIDCSNTAIDSLSPLTKVLNLEELNCSHTKITTIEPLQNLIRLQKLSCSYTNISTLEPLCNLTELHVLNCSHTRIGSLKPLQGLIDLQTLNCGFTGITTLKPLQGLINLQTLDCRSTEITTLEPLQGLINLQTLDCGFTGITTLKPLQGLINLQKLTCDQRRGVPVAYIKEFKKQFPKLNVVGSSDCFIATTVYGSLNAEEVVFLKYFRDNVLNQYSLGRYFISWYYSNGFTLAKLVGGKPLLKLIIRKMLDYIVVFLKKFITT